MPVHGQKRRKGTTPPCVAARIDSEEARLGAPGPTWHWHHSREQVWVSAATVHLESPMASQLHPNNWVPVRPAQSRSVPTPRAGTTSTRTGWDRGRRAGMQWETTDLPRNAQVVGSSPTSGSTTSGSVQRHYVHPSPVCFGRPVPNPSQSGRRVASCRICILWELGVAPGNMNSL
jgi:hypothetical protein